MTVEEAVQELKNHIDAQKADMLLKMNTKFENVKTYLKNAIKEATIIVEVPDKKTKSRFKRYQN